MINRKKKYTVLVEGNSDLSPDQQTRYIRLADQSVEELDKEMYGSGRAIIDFCCVGFDRRSHSPRGIAKYGACSRNFARRLKKNIDGIFANLNIRVSIA